MALQPEQRVPIDELIDAICEERIDPAGMDRLDRLLKDDPAAQRYYLERIDLYHTLRWQLTSQATYQSLAQLKSAGFSLASLTARSPRRGWNGTRWLGPAAAASIAAIVLISIAVGIWKDQPQPPVAKLEPPSPPTKRLKTPEPEPIPTATPLGEIVEVAQADGEGLLASCQSGTDLPAGTYRLRAGLVRIRVVSGATVSVEGPAEFALNGPRAVFLQRGTLAALVPPQAEGFTVSTPNVRVIDRGTEFGIHVDPTGVTKVAVFRGEIEADVDSAYLGMRQAIRLTRNDGMTIDRQGAITTAIMRDNQRFARLRQSPDLRVPTLANGSFEYPRTQHHTTAAPAGWTLLAHPIANADQMEVNAGIVRAGQKQAAFPGQAPDAPHGRQWVYLTARTFPDGRTTHVSMHQSVGLVVAGVTYRLRAAVGRQANAGPTGYQIGLYAGSRADGPTTPLQTWSNPVLPAPGKTAEIELNYQSPRHNPCRGDELFVVIQATPGAKPGTQHILIDDIKLELGKHNTP